MNRETFKLHFNVAVAAMRVRCKRFITNTLPPSNRYYILQVSLIDRWVPFNEEQVIEHLWRDGHVPVWIDVTPYEEDGKDTYFELRCAGSFSNDETFFYHQKEGYPPFHCFGPIIPPGWTSDSPKFDLHNYREEQGEIPIEFTSSSGIPAIGKLDTGHLGAAVETAVSQTASRLLATLLTKN